MKRTFFVGLLGSALGTLLGVSLFLVHLSGETPAPVADNQLKLVLYGVASATLLALAGWLLARAGWFGHAPLRNLAADLAVICAVGAALAVLAIGYLKVPVVSAPAVA